mmetsp:Transcript_22294/g.34495  ORF Transcript_22294/g.34495 Transcript_22294/m.34495 type:complete len:92 (+) Transcript_22294:2071-2346(+)
MWQQGFIMDKNLFKLGKLLKEKGLDVLIPDQNLSRDSELICARAIEQDLIFVTSNKKLFNQKSVMNRCCVHFKDSPFKQYDALKSFFNFDD